MPAGRPRRPNYTPDANTVAWAKVLAARAIGKQVQDFMVAWILECRVLDDYHAMIVSMYGDGVRPIKYFEATDVILEVVDNMFNGEQHV